MKILIKKKIENLPKYKAPARIFQNKIVNPIATITNN